MEKDKQVISVGKSQSLARVGVQISLVAKVLEEDESLFSKPKQVTLKFDTKRGIKEYITDYDDTELYILENFAGPFIDVAGLYFESPLIRLPIEIEQLKNLKYLYISNSDLDMNDAIFKIKNLPNLQELNIRYSNLTILPHEIGFLSNLVRLSVSGNPQLNLSDLILKIRYLPSLIELQLNANELSTLPKEIMLLTNLTVLGLGVNPNIDLVDAFEKLKYLPHLTDLNLWKSEITHIPSEIGQLVSLENLDLWGNRLTELPFEIGQLTNLKYLQLSSNQISDTEIDKIKKLLPNCKIQYSFQK